jgi:sulfatase modifying factor 1
MRIFRLCLPVAFCTALLSSFLGVPGVKSQTFNDCPECPKMVPIPAGSFLGKKQGKKKEERLSINKAFAIGKHEVTRGQYAIFVQSTGYHEGPCVHKNDRRWALLPELNWTNPGFKQFRDEPVVCVSSQDAEAYTDWLSLITGEHYRLPTETEWRYAAQELERKSVFATNASRQPKTCEYANIADQTLKNLFPRTISARCTDGYIYTAPVGRFRTNKFGLHDMRGNVSEWLALCRKKALKPRNPPVVARRLPVAVPG